MHYRELEAIEFNQPFDVFYVCKLNAEELLEMTFSDPIRYDEKGNLRGNQRILDEDKRVKEIKDFVEGSDAAFPNSIILSANYDEDGFNVSDEGLRWRFENGKLIIPTNKKLASIIDGQHRIFGFKDANSQAKRMELVCSVYIDLPNALQAYLFATINTNQKKVDKSLAYAQFGFNADDEDSPSWSPDKLAIALHNKFNNDTDSPFYRHIKIAPQIDDVLRKELKNSK
ncbi:DGQHR domain-containing protein [Spirosoma arcticum]